jgi:methyl-accepting chemotaxis protein
MADSARGRSLFSLVSVIVLVIAVLGVGIAAVLLARTMMIAQSISTKAQTIATTGRGINTATDSIIQLKRTNEAAASILESAKPLQGALTEIVNHAGAINDLAGSVNKSAGSINDSAHGINGSAHAIDASATKINDAVGSILVSADAINGVAKDINHEAGEILDTAKEIDGDAESINNRLDTTLHIAGKIKGDTGAIVVEAVQARHLSSCIAEKVLAPPPLSSGHCTGAP